MKFGILLVTLLLFSPAVAAPPQTLQGRIYSERISLGAFVDIYERLVEFGDNNMWREILSTEAHRPGFFRNTRPSRTGTYTYEVLDSTSARLKFSPSQDGGDRILRFDDNQGGKIEPFGGGGGGGGAFLFVEGSQGAPLINQSTRGKVDPANPLRSGFVLQKEACVLVRAVGPSLSQFAVQGTARDPRLALAGNRIAQSNDDWGNSHGDALRMGQLVGAFPLLAGSKDAVLVLRLDPGAYVATASVGDDDAGEVLVEVYLFFAERQSR